VAIGFWVTGAAWVLANVAYLADATDWIFPLFLFGALTGLPNGSSGRKRIKRAKDCGVQLNRRREISICTSKSRGWGSPLTARLS
jgi:hypothetical protein